MKKIKKFRMYNRLAALLLAGSIATTLSGCDGKAEMSSLTTSDVLSITDITNVTQIDELIANGQLMVSSDLSIVGAADQLERYMNISEQLQSIDFTKVDELSPLKEEEYEKALTLSKEEIDGLIEASKYDGKDIVQLERKLNALKKLNFLYNYCTNWVHQNGQTLSINIMMAAVKASVADELEILPEQYNEIIIPPAKRSSSEGPTSYFINVGEESYEIPINSNELWNTINYIYDVQSATLEGKNEFKTYRKALNYAKTTIAAGANIKNNKLEAQYSASYIEKNYVK